MDKKSEKLAVAYVYGGIIAISISAGAFGWPAGLAILGFCFTAFGLFYLATRR